MTRALSIAVIAVLGVSARVAIFAAGTKVAAQEMKAPVMSCPYCEMAPSDMKSETDMSGKMKEMQARMKEAGVAEETMKSHMAMMNAPL